MTPSWVVRDDDGYFVASWDVSDEVDEDGEIAIEANWAQEETHAQRFEDERVARLVASLVDAHPIRAADSS